MKTLQILAILIIGFAMGALTMYEDVQINQRDYNLMLEGIEYSDTIEDNSIKFEWEGIERDIPEDGIVTVQFTTNENVVYINPVDK